MVEKSVSPEPAARVLIALLNWNGAAMTLEALKHVLTQEYPSFEVLIIDNGSTDGSLNRLKEVDRPPCRLLALPANLGFAGGMNVALCEAQRHGFAYAWLLNNDAFPVPQCLPTLVGFMEQHPSVTIVTPRLLEPSGSEQHAGGRVIWSNGDVELLLSDRLTGPAAWGTWLTGTAILVRVSAHDRLGGFDPQFFAYYEDVDLCMRALRIGGDVRAVPEAVCYHHGGGSGLGTETPFSFYIATRNSWLILRKHLPRAKRLATRFRHHGAYLEWAARFVASGQHAWASAALGGLWAALRGRYGKPDHLKGPPWLNRLLLTFPEQAQQVGRFLQSTGDFLARQPRSAAILGAEPPTNGS